MTIPFALSSETITCIVRLLVAGGLGGLIGLERDIHGRAAGLRTHILVSTGAAAFTIASIYMAQSTVTSLDGATFRSDPGRVAAQIVTGIGFIGGGAILKEGINIRGLTTAACLWIVAAIGMIAGNGLYELAVVTTLIAFLSLTVMNKFERLYKKDSYRTLKISTRNEVDVREVIDCIQSSGIKVLYCDFERNYQTGELNIKLSMRLFHRDIPDKLSHGVISKLEKSNIPLVRVQWSQ